MMGMTVYISGAITGVVNYKDMFAKVEAMLVEQGYSVFNPANVDTMTDTTGWTWADYMQYDLAALGRCSAIYMLSNWTNSKGARIEKRYAKRMGIAMLNA
jgi:hypothetical protein